MVDAEADRVGRAWTVRVVGRLQPGFALRVPLQVCNGGVLGCVVDHQHLGRQRYRLEKPVEEGHDGLSLVVRGHHHRDARLQTRTPSPRTLEISTAGRFVLRFAYSLCGVAITS